MTSARIAGRHTWHCDDCDESSFTAEEGEPFDRAWARARADGWRYQRETEEHSCPTCAPRHDRGTPAPPAPARVRRRGVR